MLLKNLSLSPQYQKVLILANDEFACIKEFVESSVGKPFNTTELLLIDGSNEATEKGIRHIYCEDLEGKLIDLTRCKC